MTIKPTVILVTIERLQEWFVAKSNDLKGLYMTGPDFATLAQDIPNVIRMLYREQHGKDVIVEESGGGDNRDVNPFRYVMHVKAA